ncbi:MAG: hypothetical protein FWC96_03930 [Oscillospiraceae bacterium]|nr:hypothetical protein [Oscillospiraceae bacterium]
MRRKTIIFFILAITAAVFMLAACNEPTSISNTADETIANADTLSESSTEILSSSNVYELCYCGDHYTHEPLRQPTPPMNIREMFTDNISEYVYGFENVHTVTYLQLETDWCSTIILWADIHLRDFSFVSLDVAGHYWYEDRQLVIDTREVLLTVPDLLPTDAVVLNVAFAHYLLPHGAIIFTDEYGVRWRMFLGEDMRGGCFPIYHLGMPHEIEAYSYNFVSVPVCGTGHPFGETAMQSDKEIIDGIHYLRDISIWFPDHWTTEASIRAQGYAVEFFNPATNRTEANYTRAEVMVEWDFGELLTAQELLSFWGQSGDIERRVIEIDGVDAAWVKSRILDAQIARSMGITGTDDTGRIIELIMIPHNNTLYTIQFIYSATWQHELDIVSAMRDSITIRSRWDTPCCGLKFLPII